MISDLVEALLFEMLRFDLGGQFMWLIFIAFVCFTLRLWLRGPSDAWVQSAPSTMLSMGVLGTFAGIVMGLSGLSAANIEDRIGDVLVGMSTAFYSSLLAMTLSLVFKCVQIRTVQKLRDADSADAAEDFADKLLIETSNSVKQLRQLNVAAREHSEYLIHITNAVADGSDSQGLLGQMAVQREHSESGVRAVVSELQKVRNQGEAAVDALMLLHQQLQKQLDNREHSERDLYHRLDGLQQQLMTMPNRRDFRGLAAVLADSVAPVQQSDATQSRTKLCP